MRHHVVQEELRERAALYALGALTQHEAQAFDRHLAGGCEVCKAELVAFDSVVEVIGLAAGEAGPPARARERLIDLVTKEGLPDPPGSVLAQSAMTPFLTIRAHEGAWIGAGEGVLVKRLFVDQRRGTVTSLYKFSPGARCPAHRHLGIEECLVLEGDCHINGEELGPGDYRCAMPGSVDEMLFTVGGTTLLIVGPERFEPLP